MRAKLKFSPQVKLKNINGYLVTVARNPPKERRVFKIKHQYKRLLGLFLSTI